MGLAPQRMKKVMRPIKTRTDENARGKEEHSNGSSAPVPPCAQRQGTVLGCPTQTVQAVEEHARPGTVVRGGRITAGQEFALVPIPDAIGDGPVELVCLLRARDDTVRRKGRRKKTPRRSRRDQSARREPAVRFLFTQAEDEGTAPVHVRLHSTPLTQGWMPSLQRCRL